MPVWLQASRTAIHDDAGGTLLDEDGPAGDRPPQMTDVARAGKGAAAGARAERQVVLRTSVVLDRGTPALDRLAGLARWGLGDRVGSGRQWVSWLHVDDWLAVTRRALGLDGEPTAPPPSGVVVASSPNPVRNAELMAALRRALRRPAAPPTPAPLVHVGALLLRTDPAPALTGRRVVSRRDLLS